jgi:hypothetical protein
MGQQVETQTALAGTGDTSHVRVISDRLAGSLNGSRLAGTNPAKFLEARFFSPTSVWPTIHELGFLPDHKSRERD